MNKAVLFLTFNRLDTTQKVFEQIKTAQPPRLYIASDGARKEKEGEIEQVSEVRKYLLDNIDWDCEIKTLFRDENLGCGVAIYQAINWFFEQEEDGIILEDDFVPNQSFFRFCEELLDKYKDNKNVWEISGNGFYKEIDTKESYFFSKIPQGNAWATWKDRWAHFQFDLSDYDEENIKNFSDRKDVQKIWYDLFQVIKQGRKDIWDYNWAYIVVANKGYCINPYVNLVSNIGLVGTHSSDFEYCNFLFKPTKELDEIIHPKEIKYNEEAIDYIYTNIFNIKKKKWPLINFEQLGSRRVITILGFIKIKYLKKN